MPSPKFRARGSIVSCCTCSTSHALHTTTNSGRCGSRLIQRIVSDVTLQIPNSGGKTGARSTTTMLEQHKPGRINVLTGHTSAQVLSSTHAGSPLGVTRTPKTSSVISSVRVWLIVSCRREDASSTAMAHSQNLTLWSALPLTKPLQPRDGCTQLERCQRAASCWHVSGCIAHDGSAPEHDVVVCIAAPKPLQYM